MNALLHRAAARSARRAAPVPKRLSAWLRLQGFAGIHARDAGGNTPIMRAAAQGEEGIVDALLSCGAAADALNDQGNNALWFASLYGSVAIGRRLLAAGLPIDHANDDDITCAMLAAACGHHAMLALLLDHGANGDRCAPDGRTARDMAVIALMAEFALSMETPR
ncbi:ankyrin repeat domain-containing protein [Variovorax ginsengisoli]|uniref:Ankyrin repeat protein n=1 Tax=Variovorax ginsengisoli TaxID=363844 RepID=A0ABT9SEF0_9BURK|nr:ankyrin repeat domain-containing protein [Variovorax ginsengisoli]MDP9902729.1 ankyrin repeat protein [Variovorax ginsengisoli]